MPDKHEVDGSIPFEPTTNCNLFLYIINIIIIAKNIRNYKRVVQGNRGKIFEIILIVYRKNFDEDGHSNTKFRISKISTLKNI